MASLVDLPSRGANPVVSGLPCKPCEGTSRRCGARKASFNSSLPSTEQARSRRHRSLKNPTGERHRRFRSICSTPFPGGATRSVPPHRRHGGMNRRPQAHSAPWPHALQPRRQSPGFRARQILRSPDPPDTGTEHMGREEGEKAGLRAFLRVQKSLPVAPTDASGDQMAGKCRAETEAPRRLAGTARAETKGIQAAPARGLCNLKTAVDCAKDRACVGSRSAGLCNCITSLQPSIRPP